MSDLDFTPTPDVQPGELIYLADEDLWDRLAFALDKTEDVLETILDSAHASIHCDECFMGAVEALVGTVFTAAGIVSLDMEPDIVSEVRNEYLAQVARLAE